MSKSEAAGGTEAIIELECHEAHRDGHVSAAWLGTDAQVLAVVTAGRDGVLARKQIRPAADPKTTRMTKGDAGINVLELNADSTMAAIGVNSTAGSEVKVILCIWHLTVADLFQLSTWAYSMVHTNVYPLDRVSTASPQSAPSGSH